MLDLTKSRTPIRVLTVTSAITAALTVWLVAVPMAGVDLTARAGSGTLEVGAGHVIVAAMLAGVAGWALLAFLERRTENATRVWTGIAIGVLAVSMIGPLGAETLGGTLILALMHLVTAAVLVAGYRIGGSRLGAPARPSRI
jgi:hypothetical protein